MAEDAEYSRRDRLIEVVIAIVLSIGGLMSSWASYQAALWDGEQMAYYSRANAQRMLAARERLESDAHHAIEVNLFNGWLQAWAHGDHALAEFYAARFPANFKPAFNAWLATRPLTNPKAPPSPFAMAERRLDGRNRGARLEAEADKIFAAGQDANRTSDLFTQGALILATSMFFGGIGQVFKVTWVRMALLAISLVSCIGGVARIVSLPGLSPN